MRADIDRAMRESETVNESYRNAARGVAALGGGITIGALIGRRIRRAMNKRNLAKNAMAHVKLGDAVLKPDNFNRFRSAEKAKRK